MSAHRAVPLDASDAFLSPLLRGPGRCLPRDEVDGYDAKAVHPKDCPPAAPAATFSRPSWEETRKRCLIRTGKRRHVTPAVSVVVALLPGVPTVKVLGGEAHEVEGRNK